MAAPPETDCPNTNASLFDCAQANLLVEHAQSLDHAHAKLRAHGMDIDHLKHQICHVDARLEDVERTQLDVQRTLVRIDGRLSNVESKIEHVEATALSTHSLLTQHVANGIAAEEKTQRRLIRITGALGAILILIALLYSAGNGHFWTLVTGFLG